MHNMGTIKTTTQAKTVQSNIKINGKNYDCLATFKYFCQNFKKLFTVGFKYIKKWRGGSKTIIYLVPCNLKCLETLTIKVFYFFRNDY